MAMERGNGRQNLGAISIVVPTERKNRWLASG